MFNPPGTTWGALDDVACPTTDKCVAVGNFVSSAGHWLSYAATWTAATGTSPATWALQRTPNVAGVSGSAFQAISCPTASQCLAVGQTLGPAKNSPWHPFAGAPGSC
jgi:hypothetical protein